MHSFNNNSIPMLVKTCNYMLQLFLNQLTLQFIAFNNSSLITELLIFNEFSFLFIK